MRVVRGVGLAVVAALLVGAVDPAQAQTLGNAGPAETPPANFTGEQYVDSRGCIFDRFGQGASAAWSLRPRQMRAAICEGRTGRSLNTVASTRNVLDCTPAAAASGEVPGCRPHHTAARPRAQVVQTYPAANRDPFRFFRRQSASGRQLVVPVTVDADGDTRLAPSAFLARQIEMREGRTMFSGGAERLGFGRSTRGTPVIVRAARSTFDVSRPPPGYKVDWDDGRLNPHRGPRTLQGDFQSLAVWTNDTPRQLRPAILARVRR